MNLSSARITPSSPIIASAIADNMLFVMLSAGLRAVVCDALVRVSATRALALFKTLCSSLSWSVVIDDIIYSFFLVRFLISVFASMVAPIANAKKNIIPIITTSIMRLTHHGSGEVVSAISPISAMIFVSNTAPLLASAKRQCQRLVLVIYHYKRWSQLHYDHWDLWWFWR